MGLFLFPVIRQRQSDWELLLRCYLNVSTSMELNAEKRACFFSEFTDITLEENNFVYIFSVVTCVLNSCFCLTAITGNILVLLAVWRSHLKRSPSNLLLANLAVADLLVGAVVQTSFVWFKIAEIYKDESLACYSRFVNIISGYATTAVSLLTLTAIAIERFLALYLHLRYQEVITKCRILFAAGLIWMLSFIVTSLFFIHRRVFSYIVIVSEIVSIAITCVAYIKIHKIVRRHAREIESQRRVSVDPSGDQELNMKKYQRSTFTMVIVFLLSSVCHLPYSVVMVLKLKYGYTWEVKVAIDIFATVVCINSSLNPLIYCLRMKEIKLAVLALLKRSRSTVSPTDLNERSMMTYMPAAKTRQEQIDKSTHEP